MEFDADGSYYGGPIGTDLSQTYSYSGAYSYDANGPFHLLDSCGDGCSGEGFFNLAFQNACATATLDETMTHCTGNRIAVAGNIMLTRQ